MKRNRVVLCAVLAALAAEGLAQEPKPEQKDVFFEKRILLGPAPGEMGGMTYQKEGVVGASVAFISSEMGIGGAVVKGMPFSAQAVTETTQNLADGNRIHRETKSALYRDSEGRVRREQSIGAIGPFGSVPDAPQITTLQDPVAGVSYILDAAEKTYRKTTMNQWFNSAGTIASGVRVGPAGAAPVPMPAPVMVKLQSAAPAAPKTENLGKQVMEGVQVEGTRTTITIAAGEIGNDRPIEVVSERWYSPDLQVVVMSKNSDPRMGDTVYHLTNLNRAEPARSLFEVPADYTQAKEFSTGVR